MVGVSALDAHHPAESVDRSRGQMALNNRYSLNFTETFITCVVGSSGGTDCSTADASSVCVEGSTGDAAVGAARGSMAPANSKAAAVDLPSECAKAACVPPISPWLLPPNCAYSCQASHASGACSSPAALSRATSSAFSRYALTLEPHYGPTLRALGRSVLGWTAGFPTPTDEVHTAA